MSNIAITINDVVRNYMDTIDECYKSYSEYKQSIEEDEFKIFDLDDEDNLTEHKSVKKKFKLDAKTDPFGLHKKYKFNNLEEFEDFLSDYSFKISASATMVDGVTAQDFNELYTKLVRQGHTVTLISQESGATVPSTYYFIASNQLRTNKVAFYGNFSKIWQKFDTIITANPYIIGRCNLDKKTCIKIERDYNQHLPATVNVSNLKKVIELI